MNLDSAKIYLTPSNVYLILRERTIKFKNKPS